MKRVAYVLVFVLCVIMISNQAIAIPLLKAEVPSSMNPVGSGARSLGMGGAFIGVADDATSASWNPGGLIQLQKPEFSVVFGNFCRNENNQYDLFDKASGDQPVNSSNLNYLSVAYPFIVNDCNMIISLNYQHLYDFNREWKDNAFSIEGNFEDVRADYEQSGSLYALGLAFSAQVNKYLSLGLTLNIWDDFFKNNEWEQKYKIIFPNQLDDVRWYMTSEKKCNYSFKGFNMNLGFLWRVNNKWTIGGVLKTPFEADIDRVVYKKDTNQTVSSPGNQEINEPISTEQPHKTYKDNLVMPMSYGIGAAYRLNDFFTASFDIFRTNWNEYEYRHENGNRASPVSGRLSSESDVGPTTWCRAGMEYLIIGNQSVIPFRAGFFYDSTPAEGSPDDFFGLTLGSGYAYEFKDKICHVKSVIFDIAYQYRFANNVGESVMEETSFSQDVNEHTIYSSLIVHF